MAQLPKLPPGAKLVQDGAPKLPPGARRIDANAAPPQPFGPTLTQQGQERVTLLNEAERMGLDRGWSNRKGEVLPDNAPTTEHLRGLVDRNRIPVALTRGVMTGVERALGLEQGVVPAVKGMYDTLAAPPQGNVENFMQHTVPWMIPMKRLGQGMVEGIVHNVKEGIPDAYSGIKEYMQSGDAEQLERGVRGATQTAATVGPLVSPTLRAGRAGRAAAGRAIEGPARDAGLRTARAGPQQVARASGEVADETAAVSAKNVKATEGAQAKNAAALAEAERAYQEALEAWKKETTEGQAKYDEAVAQQRRKLDLETEAEAKSGEFGTEAKKLRETQDKAAKALYDGIAEKVVGEADAVAIGAEIDQTANAVMKQYGSIPGEIQRIKRAFTPAETSVPDVYPDVSGEAFARLAEEGAFTEAELAAMSGETPVRANFDSLHSQSSALGKMANRARRMGNRVEEAAYTATRKVIDSHLNKLLEAAGQTEAYGAAKKNYATMMQTFFDRSSPIAKLLKEFNPPATGGAPRALNMRNIIMDPQNYRVLRDYLQGNTKMLDALESIRNRMKESGKITSKEPKPFVPKAEPVREPPVPAHTAELQPPPKPFNRQEFVKRQVQSVAEDLQATRGPTWIYRHPMGRVLERPGVQEWLAAEPPPPLRGQPGQSGAQGAGSPYDPPPRTPRGADRRVSDEGPVGAERRSASRRVSDAVRGPITPHDELLVRNDYMMEKSVTGMSGYLRKLGIDISEQELNLYRKGSTLYGELHDILRDLGDKPLKPAQIRSIADALRMKTKDPFEMATTLRSRLFPEKKGS